MAWSGLSCPYDIAGADDDSRDGDDCPTVQATLCAAPAVDVAGLPLGGSVGGDLSAAGCACSGSAGAIRDGLEGGEEPVGPACGSQTGPRRPGAGLGDLPGEARLCAACARDYR